MNSGVARGLQLGSDLTGVDLQALLARLGGIGLPAVTWVKRRSDHEGGTIRRLTRGRVPVGFARRPIKPR